jgi:predicted glycosyltransferase
LSLVWNADLVVSGGGTMNREAAALGVPVYSIFCGRLGAVDRELSAQRRLTLIADPGELRDKLVVAKRPKTPSCSSDTDSTLHAIVDHIVRIAQGSADGPHCP